MVMIMIVIILCVELFSAGAWVRGRGRQLANLALLVVNIVRRVV